MWRTRPVPRILPLPAALVLAAGVGFVPAGAQTAVIDEGVFTVYVAGRQVGNEAFTIRRQGSGGGATYLANAVVGIEGAEAFEMRPTLRADSDRTPALYENPIQDGDISRVEVRNMGRRYVAAIRSEAGERVRELRAEQGTRLLDPWVAHHHWFLGEVTEGQSIPVLVPRTGEQVRLTVASVATGPFKLAGRTVEARRVSLVGSGRDRIVWFDEQGRVLQVEVEGEEYRAVRQDL